MKKYNRKGGRPRADEVEYKEYVVSTRLDVVGHLKLETLKQESGKSSAEVIRELIMHGWVKEKMKRMHLDFMAQLKGIARNFNQLTKLANGVGLSTVGQKLNPLVAEIEQILKQIRNDR